MRLDKCSDSGSQPGRDQGCRSDDGDKVHLAPDGFGAEGGGRGWLVDGLHVFPLAKVAAFGQRNGVRTDKITRRTPQLPSQTTQSADLFALCLAALALICLRISHTDTARPKIFLPAACPDAASIPNRESSLLCQLTKGPPRKAYTVRPPIEVAPTPREARTVRRLVDGAVPGTISYPFTPAAPIGCVNSAKVNREVLPRWRCDPTGLVFLGPGLGHD